MCVCVCVCVCVSVCVCVCVCVCWSVLQCNDECSFVFTSSGVMVVVRVGNGDVSVVLTSSGDRGAMHRLMVMNALK